MGPQETLLLVAVIAIAFGGGRFADVARSIGRSFFNFRRALDGKDEVDVTPAEPEMSARAEGAPGRRAEPGEPSSPAGE